MPFEQQAKQSNALSELPVRGYGLLVLICGAGIGYLTIVAPLLAAARHDQSVSITLTGAAITPLALAFGAVYTLLPNQASAILGLSGLRKWATCSRPSSVCWASLCIGGSRAS